MKCFAVNLVCLVCGVAGVANGDDSTFRFKKSISASAKAEESLVAVPLDSDVYAATQSDLADLRLQDEHRTNLPFLIRKSQELRAHTVRRKTWTAAKPAVRPLDNGGLEITLELDEKDPQPNGLTLVSPLHNFEQQVRILTSADGQTWEPVGGETVIFDYSRYMDVRNDNVPFPASARKHVRLIIDDVTVEQQSQLLELTRTLRDDDEVGRSEKVVIDRRPFRIERIDFWVDSSEEVGKGDHKLPYQISGYKVSEDPKTHQTIITIETRREPLTSLILESTARNFSRHCVVEIAEPQGVQTSWSQIGTATLSRLDFKDLKREELAVTFPETRAANYRLVIDNRDSSPLEVTGIKAEGNVYELVFLSAPKASCQLLYSDSEAKAPHYDTASIQTLLTESYRPEVLKLGAEEAIDGAGPAGFQWSKLINDPRVMTVVIGVLVVLLGWGLYGAVKRMDATEPPSADAK
ncbi:MAG: hypothetical protein JSS49_14690 [Planctomycetes bacterium]|nr:hypothetical protein [Planctomycetota bacterium]